MGILKRIKTITMAEINGLLDGIEDPIAMLNEYSREMEQEILKGQKALSLQIFVENKQAALILETEKLAAKRTRQAKLAIEQGEDSIAKIAVQEKLVHEKQLNLYKQQYQAVKDQTQILLEKLNQLRETYKEMQHKKILLASRAKEQILIMEAEVQAGQQFSTPMAQFDLAFSNLIDEEELNKELEKLKGEKVLQLEKITH
jgi:phage shock protein A